MERIDEIANAVGCARAPAVEPCQVVGFVITSDDRMMLTLADGSQWIASGEQIDAFSRILKLEFRTGIQYVRRRTIAGHIEFHEAGR